MTELQDYDYQCYRMAHHVILRPKVYRDGNQWCCLYGENIMEGVCGFGDTPKDACAEFDRIWEHGK